MYELPLFPLSVVLFPGMPLKLHIFEERYKLMIGRCYETGQPFGVTLIKSGVEVGGRAQPFATGCTALITQFERLPDGRINIVAVGHERFHIVSLKHDQPYLVGMVEAYPLASAEASDIMQSSGVLRIWVKNYLEKLAQATKTQVESIELPEEPLRLAYLASFLLNIPTAQKQTLLDIEKAEELISSLRGIYRREVTLMDMFLTAKEGNDTGPFSAN